MPELTLEQAGAELGLSPDTLRSQIRYGKLRGRKVGPVWVVTRRELERYRGQSRRGHAPVKVCGEAVFGVTCTMPVGHAGAHGVDLGTHRL